MISLSLNTENFGADRRSVIPEGVNMRLHHVGLVCSSQENADRFYHGVLGLEKIKTSELKEDLTEGIFHRAQRCQMIFYGNDELALEVFVPEEWPARNVTFEHICLEVPEREAFLTRCRDNGLEVRRIPRGDTFLVFIADFDGNLFEVKEARC
jgi:catechol 2,3-dioxygenase-like lactoylglutathione lyase family enzyme